MNIGYLPPKAEMQLEDLFTAVYVLSKKAIVSWWAIRPHCDRVTTVTPPLPMPKSSPSPWWARVTGRRLPTRLAWQGGQELAFSLPPVVPPHPLWPPVASVARADGPSAAAGVFSGGRQPGSLSRRR